MKFQIVKILENEKIFVEVLDGNKIVLSQDFNIAVDLNIEKIKQELRESLDEIKKQEKRNAELLKKEQEKKDQLNKVIDQFQSLLNKEMNL